TGPCIWFHVVPSAKVVKSRLHPDIYASGERMDPIETRRKRFDAEASRLAGLGATFTGALSGEGLDHYAVEPFPGQCASEGGAQAGQPAGLRVEPLPARLDRVHPLAAGVDVGVQPALDHLGTRDDMEPDARPG